MKQWLTKPGSFNPRLSFNMTMQSQGMWGKVYGGGYIQACIRAYRCVVLLWHQLIELWNMSDETIRRDALSLLMDVKIRAPIGWCVYAMWRQLGDLFEPFHWWCRGFRYISGTLRMPLYIYKTSKPSPWSAVDHAILILQVLCVGSRDHIPHGRYCAVLIRGRRISLWESL
jgi:hypothetical protein